MGTIHPRAIARGYSRRGYKKIYLCGAIGGNHSDHHHFISKTAHYILDQGGDVLDEHIKAETIPEMIEVVYQKTGVRRDQVDQPWTVTYQQDMEWIKQAEHLIAFVDGPSLGVGIEISRALDKEALGQNRTPILLLVHADNLEKLSLVARGLASTNQQVELKTYQNFEDIKQLVDSFLLD